jgi:hypothetical protein
MWTDRGFGASARHVLRCIRFAVKVGIQIAVQPVSPMSRVVAQPQIVTSARMAAGMTSRARRPEPCHSTG